MTTPHRHSRSSSAGSAYHFILEHVLSYPGTYEIPLRTMYTLNCAPRAQSQSPATRSPSPTSGAPNSSPNSPNSPWHDHQAATAHFTQSLMQQISQLPQQPSSLPPVFVTNFLNRSFPLDLQNVDFAQGLTGLDYLKDLEYRRRKEVTHVLTRLGIDQEVVRSAGASEDIAQAYPDITALYPDVPDWVLTLEAKGKKADNLYTQLYVSLRRWLLINEMSLPPFSKTNCHAMLNTLYPPMLHSAPTTQLPPTKLREQRDGFFKWIQTVERRGPTCLTPLMNQGRRDGDENGWAAVRRTLSNYLTLTNSMINDCQDMCLREMPNGAGPVFNQTPAIPLPGQDEEFETASSRKGKKTDSGVSFNSATSHAKTSSTASAATSKTSLHTASTVHDQHYHKGPLRPSTPHFTPSSRPATPSSTRSGSTLERIARELRRMRPRGRIEVDEIVKSVEKEKENLMFPAHSPRPGTPSRLFSGGLRKMKSLGALGGNAVVSPNEEFDVLEMKRRREEWERRAGR